MKKTLFTSVMIVLILNTAISRADVLPPSEVATLIEKLKSSSDVSQHIRIERGVK